MSEAIERRRPVSHPNMKLFSAWMNYAAAYYKMTMAAGEVIMRRSQRMALGAMTPPEAVEMVMEKPTALAQAAEAAAVAAARGGDGRRIAAAALAPYGKKTRANVRRLRK